jgi:hypothetical protein
MLPYIDMVAAWTYGGGLNQDDIRKMNYQKDQTTFEAYLESNAIADDRKGVRTILSPCG